MCRGRHLPNSAVVRDKDPVSKTVISKGLKAPDAGASQQCTTSSVSKLSSNLGQVLGLITNLIYLPHIIVYICMNETEYLIIVYVNIYIAI